MATSRDQSRTKIEWSVLPD